MTHQCKSCGGFCGKAGCERRDTIVPCKYFRSGLTNKTAADCPYCRIEALESQIQAAQPAPRRLTEAEITLLVEAYYEDVGIAPPDLIRQVEGLIFGDAQPAHAHAIDTSLERVEKQAGNVRVPVNCHPGSPGWPTALRDLTIDAITDGCFQAVGYQGTTVLMRAVARAVERHHGIAAPSPKEGQP